MDSIPDVIEALDRAPRIVIPLIREVPAAMLKCRPATRKWSAHEHACHLAVVHKLFFDRMDQMLNHPKPMITPYDPGAQDANDALLKIDLSTALAAYANDRERLISKLRCLSLEDWQRTAEHGEYSHYSVFIMFRHLALHDLFHAYRIEELLLKREWAADWHAPQPSS